MKTLIDILKPAEAIAREAGALLRDAYSKPREISYKGVVELVTQSDVAAEKIIVDGLIKAFPDHAIFSEEGSRRDTSDGYLWFVDPLDGTTNFAHGFPMFAVSMALRDAEGLLVGVVYDPLRDECFTAARGHGAHLNGQPVRVSPTPLLDKSLLATGFPYDVRTTADNNVEAFGVFARRCQGIRRAGAAALDLSYVACGRLDAYWELRLQPYDIGAGVLIVREAGGTVTTYSGDPSDHTILLAESVVASNGLIHSEMLSTLNEIYN
jgi:myo-inositol-1(or 4)-monophosphatase